ncbi:MAG: HDOD domain-containing protein [Desulfovibrionaceae bacterium]
MSDVQAPEDVPSEDVPSEILDLVRQIADRTFEGVSMRHPAMPPLRRMAEQRLARRLMDDPDWRPACGWPRFDIREFLHRKIEYQPLGPLQMAVRRIKLPTLPRVWFELRRAMEQPVCDSEHIARIVSVDPKLTAIILSLVNSPFFGLSAKVDTISRAVTVLGTKPLSGLALGSMLVAMFQDVAPEVLDVNAFWRHCMCVAVLGRNLAVRAGRSDPERYFVAGLLHDLGRIALFSAEPELSKMAIALQQQDNLDLAEAERKVFDFDHAMLGALLLKEWRLPGSLVVTAMHHHSAEGCVNHEVAEVVHVANCIAVTLGYGACEETRAPRMGLECWRRLGVPPEALEEIVADMDAQVEGLFAPFARTGD